MFFQQLVIEQLLELLQKCWNVFFNSIPYDFIFDNIITVGNHVSEADNLLIEICE